MSIRTETRLTVAEWMFRAPVFHYNAWDKLRTGGGCMFRERLVVVGGVAAGLSAASQARRINPQLEIIAYEKGPDISYSACGIPYLISGAVRRAEELRVYSPEFFRERRNIQVLIDHEVCELSTSRHRVTVAARGGSPVEVHYDHLVLATGAEPARPPIPGINLGGVFHANDLQAALALQAFLEARRPRRAVIIGGGYIGLEMAEALATRGAEVTVVERSAMLFESVDEEISTLVDQELSARGVTAVRGAKVAALLGEEGRVRRVMWDGGDGGGSEADLVVLATGVRPRTRLAVEAGIQLGLTGAIAVNEYMETSAAAVFAAGDCAECLHRVSGRPTYVPLGTTANKQGRVAGQNAAGVRARFPGIVGTAALKVFSLEVARTGLSLAQARAAGFRPRQAIARAPSRARYLGGKDLTIALVADPASGRLLGAQLAGSEGVAKRIDVFATALEARMTVEQISQLDLSYAPPFAPVWDPVLIGAQAMLRELKR